MYNNGIRKSASDGIENFKSVRFKGLLCEYLAMKLICVLYS